MGWHHNYRYFITKTNLPPGGAIFNSWKCAHGSDKKVQKEKIQLWVDIDVWKHEMGNLFCTKYREYSFKQNMYTDAKNGGWWIAGGWVVRPGEGRKAFCHSGWPSWSAPIISILLSSPSPSSPSSSSSPSSFNLQKSTNAGLRFKFLMKKILD